MSNPENNEKLKEEVTLLADGREVESALLPLITDGLKRLLEEHGSLAAHDLRRIAGGEQPILSPHGDMRAEYVSAGLCDADREGRVSMRPAISGIVENSVHINPENVFQCMLVDPTQPFAGFQDWDAAIE